MEQVEKQILRVHITTTITSDLLEKARCNRIKLSEALRVGVGVMLAEAGDDTYTGSLNVYRKLNRLQEILEETGEQLEKIKNHSK